MGMKDWWKRLLARFSREEEVREDEQVVELVPAPAPEPEPEQKTSDELILQMAEAQADPGRSREDPDPKMQGLRSRPLRRTLRKERTTNSLQRKRSNRRYLTRTSVKESGMTSDKSIKRSRRLLGVYWLYKVLNGGNIAKTTLNALKIEAASMKQEYRNRHANGQTVKRADARAGSGKRAQRDSKRTGKSRGASGTGLFKAVLKKARVI